MLRGLLSLCVAVVSVPRRALRGHAPLGGMPVWRSPGPCFSAPKGVERACPPEHQQMVLVEANMFQCPEGR